MNIKEAIYVQKEVEYARFTAPLIPNIPSETILGVRIPYLRKLAKQIRGLPETKQFMEELPHHYHEENILHAVLVSDLKDETECLRELERFLPFVTNWAVSDTLKANTLAKDPDNLKAKIYAWVGSKDVYTVRFGLKMIMDYFLGDSFDLKLLELAASIRTDEYYINMMVAWLFATALAKQWDATIPFVEDGCLDTWTHNKAIQKSQESYRVSEEHKAYLKTLKRG